jgi:hypothetical protein
VVQGREIRKSTGKAETGSVLAIFSLSFREAQAKPSVVSIYY